MILTLLNHRFRPTGLQVRTDAEGSAVENLLTIPAKATQTFPLDTASAFKVVTEQVEVNHSATENFINDASYLDCSRTDDPSGEGMTVFCIKALLSWQIPPPKARLNQLILVSMRMSQKLFTYSGRHINTRVTYSANWDCSSVTNVSLSLSLSTLKNQNRNNKGIDYGGFEYVKKRGRRYYLGRLMPTITREVIAEYVTMPGPTVTWVSIWNSKRNPDNVVIRLNVADNQLPDILEKRSFWPGGGNM